MANIEDKFVLFLSDPQFSKNEISKFHMSLNKEKINSLFKQSLEIKKILSKESYKSKKQSFSEHSSLENKTLDEVNSTLRQELNMNVKDAIHALSLELEIVPPPPNKSFQDQVLYLVDKTSGSEVINATYKIRNMKVHSDIDSDWPLRNN